MKLAPAQVVAELFNPLTVVMLLIVAAWVWRGRGRWLLGGAILLLMVFGHWTVPSRMGGLLTSQHEPVMQVRPEVRDVVVLAAGAFSEAEDLAANNRVNGTYLSRFLEGVRIHRAAAGGRLIVSVSRPDDSAAARRILDELAALVGVDGAGLEPIVGANSTADEARLARPLVGTNSFYLVTSDLHLPRAMLLFRQQGLNPIAAPAGACGRGGGRGEARLSEVLYPDAGSLEHTDAVLHEALGILWARMRGGGESGGREDGESGKR
jgi:uncharacterized SAM-binding protein YcdF (DUF218 family)